MKKNSFYIIIIVVLIIINICTLYFSMETKHTKPREIIIEKLGFDSNQIIEYDKIIKVHQKTIRNLNDSVRKSKNELYHLLTKDNIDLKNKENLTLKITIFQNKIERTHFNHFLEIKHLCHKDQLEKFNSLSNELSKLFAPKGMPKNEN